MRRFLLLALLSLALSHRAGAVEPSERLADPVLEARARAISKELRCLVCQNESIDESSADLAHDIRVLLRQRIAAGDTDTQATDYIVARYGQFVLLKPPIEPATYALWFGPPLLLALGAVTLMWRVRQRGRRSSDMAPLNADEQARLGTLLSENKN